MTSAHPINQYPRRKSAPYSAHWWEMKETSHAIKYLEDFILEKLAKPDSHSHFVDLWLPLLVDLESEPLRLQKQRKWPRTHNRKLEHALRNTFLAVVVVYALTYVGCQPVNIALENRKRQHRVNFFPITSRRGKGSFRWTRRRPRSVFRSFHSHKVFTVSKHTLDSENQVHQGQSRPGTSWSPDSYRKELMAWSARRVEGQKLMRRLVPGYFSSLVKNADSWARLSFLKQTTRVWCVPFVWPMDSQTPHPCRKMMERFFRWYRWDYRCNFDCASAEFKEDSHGRIKIRLGCK